MLRIAYRSPLTAPSWQRQASPRRKLQYWPSWHPKDPLLSAAWLDNWDSMSPTAMTARLRSLGLLERLPDQDDSRAWNLQLTTSGRAALKRIEAPFRQINRKIELALNPEEIANLADYIHRMSDAFEEP